MSLTEDEVVDLLTVAAVYDNRKANPDALLAFGEASRRGRWTYQDAIDCVHEHYSRSTDFLMPAHITALLREVRVQPPNRRELAGDENWLASHPGDGPNPTGPPADPAHVAEVMAKLAAEMGWHTEIDRRTALSVRCPWCGEQPGHPCTRPTKHTGTGLAPMKTVHPARTELAQASTPTDQENPS